MPKRFITSCCHADIFCSNIPQCLFLQWAPCVFSEAPKHWKYQPVIFCSRRKLKIYHTDVNVAIFCSSREISPKRKRFWTKACYRCFVRIPRGRQKYLQQIQFDSFEPPQRQWTRWTLQEFEIFVGLMVRDGCRLQNGWIFGNVSNRPLPLNFGESCFFLQFHALKAIN